MVRYNENSAIARALTEIFGKVVKGSNGHRRGGYAGGQNPKGLHKRTSKKTRTRRTMSGRKKKKLRKSKGSRYIYNIPSNFAFKTTYKKKKNNRVDHSKQLVTVQENSVHSIACNGGRQESNIIPDAICRSNVLSTIMQKGRVFWLNPPVSGVRVDDTVVGYNYNSFFLQEVKSVYRISNQSPSSVEVKLYLLMSKENQTIDPDPVTDWTTGLTNASGVDPSPSRNYIDAEPTESYQFNLNWKVHKRISFKVLPGEEQKITWHFEINRLMESGRFKRFLSQRGYTFKWMQTICGAATGDSLNNFGTGLTVTSTPAKCVGTIQNTYIGRMTNVFPRISYKDQDMTAITPSAGPLVNLFTIADQSGAVVDNAETTNYA